VLSLIYSLDRRYRPARWIAALRAEPVIHRLRADPLVHPGMTNKSGASRACETPASFG